MDNVVEEKHSAKLKCIAVILLPGDDRCPAFDTLTDFDATLGDAVAALGPDTVNLIAALDLLPSRPTVDDLRRLFDENRSALDVVAVTASACYFTSPVVLKALSFPIGRRTAAPLDLAAEQLEGLLDSVPTPDHVGAKAR